MEQQEEEDVVNTDTAMKLATFSSRHIFLRRWILKNREILASLEDKAEARQAMKALEQIYRGGYEAGYGAGNRAAKRELNSRKAQEEV